MCPAPPAAPSRAQALRLVDDVAFQAMERAATQQSSQRASFAPSRSGRSSVVAHPHTPTGKEPQQRPGGAGADPRAVERATVALINEASQRWAPVGQSTGHVDDITAIAVRLPLLPDASAREEASRARKGLAGSPGGKRQPAAEAPYLQVPDGPKPTRRSQLPDMPEQPPPVQHAR